jgi:hypothetical protein
MKIIAVLFLILTSLSLSQERTLGGFENIRWGESIELSKIKMMKIDGIKFHSISGKSMRFNNGIYLNEKISSWSLNFDKAGFENIIIEFVNSEDPIVKFNKILRLLSDKYGKPKENIIKGDRKKCSWYFRNKDHIIWELSESAALPKSKKRLKLAFIHSKN